MSARPPSAARWRLDAGIAAFNEEPRISAAIASLVDQPLPEGVEWGTLWVVASGCTDRTAERARRADPRVVVVEQPERRGKASAIAEVLRRTRSDLLVLLDADDRILPGGLDPLIRRAVAATPPFAISGRPVLPRVFPRSGAAAAVRLLWEVHHRFQSTTVADRSATVLTEELLVLPGRALPPLPEGIVNDGAYLTTWVRHEGGTLDYEPRAAVEITAPTSFGGLVRQRRRIRFGFRQIRSRTGTLPASAQTELWRRPRVVWSVLNGAARAAGVPPVSAWVGLISAEVTAALLATWDRLSGASDHVRWLTIEEKASG